MQEVIMKYNPYKVVSTITVNGEEPRQNSELIQYLDQRFQLWVDELPSLLVKEYNDDEVSLTFYGTDLDFQDLLAAIKAYEDDPETDAHFDVKKEPVKEFGDKENDLRELFKRVKELPIEELKSPALENAFRLAFNELLEVNVVATMSAGKSTLINALLGKRLMPSKQGACTATITKIRDDDDKTYKADVLYKSEKAEDHYSFIDYKTMKDLNANPEVSEIDISGDIPFVESKEVSLVMIDTPGPDNARDRKHGLVTAKALDESSKMLVLFVMNGGKLHDDAQDAFLKKIAKSMSVGGKQSRERFMFVINKLDAYDEEDDDIENETIPETIEYLEKMGITKPNIFPAAAEPALLIRRYLNSGDEEEKAKLLDKVLPVAKKLVAQQQLHLEKYANLERSCQTLIDEELETAIENKDILGQALIHSGIRGIEETIKMYVTKYCRPAKITNVVNSFVHELDSAEAFEKTRKEIASRTDELEYLGSQIDKLGEKLTSKKENEAFKKKISELNITSKLNRDIKTLTTKVADELSTHLGNLPREMEEDEAIAYVRNFSGLVSDIQNQFQVTVEKILETDLKKEGQKLLDEYVSRLETISQEFNADGLSINLSSFARGKLVSLNTDSVIDDSIDSRIENHTEQRDKKVTHRRRGVDRLLHPSSWFDPYYTTIEKEDVVVEEKVSFVSREKLIKRLLAPIETRLQEEESRIKEYGEGEALRIKKYFNEQFDEVDAILFEKMGELKSATISKEMAAKELTKANSLLGQLESVKSDLDSILEI